MDLSTIIQQLAILNNTQQQQAEQVAGLMAGASKEASGVAKNLEQAGQMAADAELVRLQGELNTQNARVKVANAFGTNANAQSDVITGFAEAMRKDALELSKAQDLVSQVEANSDLLNNPVGWVQDLLFGDEIRAKRDALAASFDTKQKLVTNLNAATQTSVATQNAITETLTADSITKLAEVKALKGQNEAAEARINAAKYGVASIEALQQQGAQAFNRNLSVYNAVESAERWNLQRQEYLKAQKEKQDEDAWYADQAEAINAVRQTFGGQPVTPMYVKKFLDSPRLGPELQEQSKMGWRIIQNNGSPEGSLGATPAEAFSRVKAMDLNLPPSWKPAMSLLDYANTALQEDLAQVGQEDRLGKEVPTPLGFTKATANNPEALQQGYNSAVKGLAKTASARIQHGTGNIYQTPPIEAVLQSPTRDAQRLKESKFGKLVLESIKETGQASPAPETVIATGLTLVGKGELTMSELNEGVGMYLEEGLALTQSVGGFASLNIPAVSSYNVSIEDLAGGAKRIAPRTSFLGIPSKDAAQAWASIVGSTLGLPRALIGEDRPKVTAEKEIFDLLNPQDRTTVLTILASRKRADQIMNATKENQQ